MLNLLKVKKSWVRLIIKNMKQKCLSPFKGRDGTLNVYAHKAIDNEGKCLEYIVTRDVFYSRVVYA